MYEYDPSDESEYALQQEIRKRTEAKDDPLSEFCINIVFGGL